MIRNNDINRGLAGVSGLIVFIALVLVASLAAAVIIDTGGYLQQQAQQTGEDSADQLSSSLNIVHTTGDVEHLDPDSTGVDEPYITEVQMTVSVAPGADTLDLSQSTIEMVNDNGAATLIYEGNDNGSAFEGTFEISEVMTQSSYPLMTMPEDRYGIHIEFEDDADEEALELLEEGDNMELLIITGPGGATYEEIKVPTTLPGEERSITL